MVICHGKMLAKIFFKIVATENRGRAKSRKVLPGAVEEHLIN